jgi:hypothetical protein
MKIDDSKRMEMIFHTNSNEKRAGVAKIDFKI